MKRNSILIIVLIIIAAVASYLYFEKGKTTLAEEYTDFQVEDTASVNKIKISTLNQRATLVKENGKWVVNNKYQARQDAIDLLLKTFKQIEVLEPVSEQYFEYVIKVMSTSATRVDIYLNKDSKPYKTWYVGDATASNMGTYMLLEIDGKKSNKPMITYLPTSYGYLSSRFFTKEELWREPIALQMNPQEIKSIKVESPSLLHPEFEITNLGNENFVLKMLHSSVEKTIPAQEAIPYFKRAGKLVYEYEDVKTEKAELDSIYSSTPQYVLTLENKNGEKQSISAFWMPVRKGAKGIEGDDLQYNPDRRYGKSSLEPERALVIQNFLFDQILKPEQWLSEESVNK